MNDLSRPQLRLLIFYEWSHGTSATETAKKICQVFGDGTVTDRTIRNWFASFESGDTSLEDNPRTGRTPAEIDDQLLEAVKEKPDVTTHELETMFHCDHHTINNHLHKLGFRRVMAQWVPHDLSSFQKQTRVTICQSLLLTSQRKEFLADLVTGDESWILYNNTTHHAVWIPYGEDPPVQPKPGLHEKKCLLSCFWDMKGMLFFELIPQGRSITASIYTDQLDSLALALREKRPRHSTVHLLHDNARPHVAKDTQAKLQELGWTTVPHPPYSPDIAPSDYHLFRPLKQFLREKQFKTFDELKMEVSDFFDSRTPEFWKSGIEELPNRWLTVVMNNGDYILD
ncbi:unnamed protein product [Caenorhabditis nigoni]